MTEGIIVGLIGLLGGAIGIVLNNLFNFSDIKEQLTKKHTLEKAKKYHDSTMKDISETRKDILEARKDVEKSEILLSKVNETARGISTDVKLLSQNFQNYKENIDKVSTSERSLSEAVKIFESYIQELGKVYKQRDELLKNIGDLKREIERSCLDFNIQLEELQKENTTLKNKLKESETQIQNLTLENNELKEKQEDKKRELNQDDYEIEL